MKKQLAAALLSAIALAPFAASAYDGGPRMSFAPGVSGSAPMGAMHPVGGRPHHYRPWHWYWHHPFHGHHGRWHGPFGHHRGHHWNHGHRDHRGGWGADPRHSAPHRDWGQPGRGHDNGRGHGHNDRGGRHR